jgi:hypothetical protein
MENNLKRNKNANKTLKGEELVQTTPGKKTELFKRDLNAKKRFRFGSIHCTIIPKLFFFILFL